MNVRLFEPRDLDSVMRLAAAEGWPSLSTDRTRALQALTAPGVIALVALVDDEVIGYAHALTDGVTTTYLSTIAVDRAHRGQHAGRHLIDAVFGHSGVGRMDLLSADESEEFYRRFRHRRMPGYRLYRIDE